MILLDLGVVEKVLLDRCDFLLYSCSALTGNILCLTTLPLHLITRRPRILILPLLLHLFKKDLLIPPIPLANLPPLPPRLNHYRRPNLDPYSLNLLETRVSSAVLLDYNRGIIPSFVLQALFNSFTRQVPFH